MTESGSVRFATPADEGPLYSLLVALHTHNSHGWGFPFRPEIVLARIEQGTRVNPDKAEAEARKVPWTPRTDPADRKRGVIGVIDGTGGRLVGSVGIFLEPPLWFSDEVIPCEIWLFVRSEARDRQRHEKALFDWSNRAHAVLKAGLPEDYPVPFPLATGFLHLGQRYPAMERLWRWRSGGRKVGTLFWRD